MRWAWGGAPPFSKSPHFKNFSEPRHQGRSPPPCLNMKSHFENEHPSPLKTEVPFQEMISEAKNWNIKNLLC